tara:strand:- start:321 stop:545 length:225 start_codon:yes stop_codon:yes gene_type:complete
MPNNNKRGDNVASPRSRVEKKKVDERTKAGERHQREFTEMIKKMFSTINAQLEVEPNVNTIIDRLNKKDKKKLN